MIHRDVGERPLAGRVANSPGPVATSNRSYSRPPLLSKRSTANGVVPIVGCLVTERAVTGAQSGRTRALPAMPGMRRASASRCAARIIIFDGMHPPVGAFAADEPGADPDDGEPGLGDLLATGAHSDDDDIDDVLDVRDALSPVLATAPARRTNCASMRVSASPTMRSISLPCVSPRISVGMLITPRPDATPGFSSTLTRAKCTCESA